ncbi:MAG TPA: amino acid synthesis family protein [Dehalococcoidia bacterium]|nr:amino acid synthesis family protein [Dehalococcoidia bacterium]
MLVTRKVIIVSEEVHSEGGKPDQGGPLRKVAALAVIANPYAGRPWSENLDELVQPSKELAQLLAKRALGALGGPVESYGKAAIVGLAGEQEHANACLTSVFGDAFREAIGGGKAWLPSVTKRASAGTLIDIPLAYKDALWVRSHYDAITVAVPDAPLPEEILVGLAVANRGRINARLGGLRKEEVKGEDGLR